MAYFRDFFIESIRYGIPNCNRYRLNYISNKGFANIYIITVLLNIWIFDKLIYKFFTCTVWRTDR